MAEEEGRLRGPVRPPTFHVVLLEPQIPNNTGNIGRTCVATDCALHLIHPLGFDTSEKACRRAGLDYWPRLRVEHHADWHTFDQRHHPRRLWAFSTKATRSVFEADLCRGDYLLFGNETAGLPRHVLDRFPDRTIRFPMVADERSLNLATAVCSAVYEGVRQCLERGSLRVDTQCRIVGP